ncbi:DEAD/DEAH box helicase [Flavobacterium gawalongense]|uniref:DEAD/DEAH box helicase n=1 Tax=Flavobacterium gawalongense TaxID=2594432 RepID=A0A553BQS9_9FLAO|nr:DEAD/DEAH box helicase [Flavobacterium gawalongense]TRW99805.1 DEAD/DEAH box helicase [Flavobacterium gawalongense]TRX04111.1 DEAD/DEAH box helicase [Flavobacterium gawalongense]TRX10596.1 DEAD/DEAH box helicase [Flavobacterium gawalongense]TRX11745.1 DEAD/DEAH box helicase [Flavobacterium gawalongense]TRX29537.1 DEAD/DEAH box helicase [Flavobacterium gawalongense]
MKLKKINEKLQQALIENGLTEANAMQQETFSTLKSGADCIIIAPKGSGKSTTIVLNVIQQLVREGEESPRALIIVEDKAKVLEMEELFEKFGNYTDLRVYGVHDKGDMEYDKNYISTGIDVLIGTPNKLSEMFTTAGYNVNRLKMFILDDADPILKLRHETKIMRISNSITRTQRIIFSEQFTERIEILAEKMLVEPFEFDFDGNEEDEDEDEDFEDEEDFEPEAGDDFEEQEGDEENGNK